MHNHCSLTVIPCPSPALGTAVAAGSHNGATYFFDLRSQAALQKFARKNNHVSAVEFSASGRAMYVAYEDGHGALLA